MLMYCTGISQPAKGTIFAPSRTCSSYSGVRPSAVSISASLDFATGVRNAAAAMNFLTKLERRFSFLGVPGLIRIVIGLTALVWVLVFLNPDFRFALDLDPAQI